MERELEVEEKRGWVGFKMRERERNLMWEG
jgi:hypothetical protein